MELKKLPIEEVVDYCLRQRKESDRWDFKQKWHNRIEDLIKDIICFCNTVHQDRCYLIFGVSDDFKLVGLKDSERTEITRINSAFSGMSFAGNIKPDVSIETISYHGVKLDILIIENVKSTPIYLNKPYGEMIQGCIYARVDDRNTPNRGNAEQYVIDNLWRKRFGLTMPTINHILRILKNRSDWKENNLGFYNIYEPRYTIQLSGADDTENDTAEFYCFTQENPDFIWGTVEIKENETLIKSHQTVILDGGRLFIPVPEQASILSFRLDQKKYEYRYYLKDDDNEVYQLLMFMYDTSDSEQVEAFKELIKVVLIYRSQEEKKAFQAYVLKRLDELDERINSCVEYRSNDFYPPKKTEQYLYQLHTGYVLNQLLEEYRRTVK